MEYFYDLPLNISDFIKDVDYRYLAPTSNFHNWKVVDPQIFLTEYGNQYFNDRQIVLSKIARFFRIPPNSEGHIHCDDKEITDIKKCAINFILSGTGEMQWVNNVEGDIIDNTRNGLLYLNVKSFNILERWSGTVGLVRVDAAHRVISFDKERFCLSIRIHQPQNFLDVLNKLL